MKKIVIALTAVVLLLFPLVLYYININNIDNQIEIPGSFMHFDYNGLKEYSDMIVHCRVVDELTEENSVELYNNDNKRPTLYGFYGRRKIETIHFFKNKYDDSDILYILEPACKVNGNTTLIAEGYEKLQKGKNYILFLSKQNESGQLSIISGICGVIDMENIEAAKNCEIVQGFMTDNEYNGYLIGVFAE